MTDKIIHADPSKAFFVDMLTRDISLKECILDLVDNSVHSLVRHVDLDVTQEFFKGKTAKVKTQAKILIECNPTYFKISDTCGGISVHEAKNEVFLFGKPSPDPKHTGLGVYGIGMKRAMFKIGEFINVESSTTEDSFSMSVDASKWRATKDWTFEFDKIGNRGTAVGKTTLEVKSLHDSSKTYFAMASFITQLKQRVAVTYALFIQAGLEIRVNNEKIEPNLPEFAESKNLRPARAESKYSGVDILVMAGVTPREDHTPRGWYIFCNGRLVLDADKTDQTGWGVEQSPIHHPKYNHFLGMVHFRSKDVRKLPWTTTKEGVELESPIYQRALKEMRSQARPVLDYLNKMYQETVLESEAEREVFDSGKATKPTTSAGRTNSVFTATIKPKADSEIVSIQYKRPKKEVEKIKKAIGKPNMSNVSVGEYTFEHFLKRNT
jgi:hypothetical protein